MKNIVPTLKEYVDNNKFEVLLCILLGVTLYGIRIFSYSIGIDSDVYMQDPSNFIFEWYLKEGRFGLTIVQLLFFGDCGLNIYAQNIGAVGMLILSSILWCFIFNSHIKNNKIGIYAFILFYLSSVVWLEIIYFTFMAFACALGIMLIPISLIIWDYAYKLENKKIFLINCLLVSFIISIYQMLITLFFAGGLIVINLYFKNNQNIKELKKRILHFATFTIVALLLYFFENKISCLANDIQLDDYVTDQLFSAESYKKYIRNLGFTLYSILIGNKSILEIIDNYFHILKNENKAMLDWYSYRTNIAISIAFLLYTYKTVKEISLQKNAYLMLVNVGIISSVFIVAIVGSGLVPDRYLHALPLVLGYILLCSFQIISNKKLKIIWYAVTIIILSRQCITICYLNNSDIKRYQNEYVFCTELYSEIKNVYYKENLQQNNSKYPTVLVLGQAEIIDKNNSIRTDIIGQAATMFGNRLTKIESTLRTVPFMNALGYKMNGINEDDYRIDLLKEEAKSMPKYPQKGSIKYIKDVILVNL